MRTSSARYVGAHNANTTKFSDLQTTDFVGNSNSQKLQQKQLKYQHHFEGGLAHITSLRHDTFLRLFPRGILRILHAGEITQEENCWICGEFVHIFAAALSLRWSIHTQTHVLMSMYTPTHCPDTGRKFTRAERKAANKAKFKAEMKAKAKARKSAPKQAPKRADTPKPTRASLMRLTKAQLVEMLVGSEAPASEPASAPKPKRKKRKTTKTRKPSPTQRVADRQERAHHGRPAVGPVTPTDSPRSADVAATRETVRAVGAANARRRAFELATHWAYSPNFGGHFLPSQQEELTRLLGSTDVATYEDVVALTV